MASITRWQGDLPNREQLIEIFGQLSTIGYLKGRRLLLIASNSAIRRAI